MNARLLLLLFLLLLTGGCAPYSRIKVLSPVVMMPMAGPGLTETDKNQPLVSLASSLAAAQAAAAELQRDPRNAVALQNYNAALNGFFTVLHASKTRLWETPIRLPAPHGGYILTARTDPAHPDRHPRLYDYVPSANLEVSGKYITERTIKPGLGTPLVAIRREPRPDARERYSLDRAYYGVTAIARFNGRHCEIEFADPLAAEDVRLSGKTFPLGADFTAPLAMMLKASDAKREEMQNLLRPADPAQSARLVRLQGFDPNKTTVVVVHGLASSSATWVPVLNALRGDPDIRRRFQFWFFEYPSGCPYPYSAAILRRELEGALKLFPQGRPMIFVGHSMGGLISRLMITDSGDTIWRQLLPAAPDQLPLTPEERKIVKDSLIFSARRDIGRVIFIATPHRGSHLATGWLSRLSHRMIRLPKSLQAKTKHILATASESGPKITRRMPNSIDTLSPDDAFVKIAITLPVRKGVGVHSIIGDRGKGDSPGSTDGVVPYWSSHLDGVSSELIVPASHSAHRSPNAIAEILRILHAHR